MERKAKRSEPLIKEILQATFPDYNGRKIKIKTEFPSSLHSYWSGGSKRYFRFYQPATGKLFHINDLDAPWIQYKENREFNPEMIPDSVILVEHRYFCGENLGITIYVKEPDYKLLEE